MNMVRNNIPLCLREGNGGKHTVIELFINHVPEKTGFFLWANDWNASIRSFDGIV